MGVTRKPFAHLAALLLASSTPIAMPKMTLPSDNFRGRQMERSGAHVTAIDGTVYTTRWDGRLERGDYQTGARQIRKLRKQAAFGIKPGVKHPIRGAFGSRYGWADSFYAS